MRLWLAGLLFLGLVACDEAKPPSAPVTSPVAELEVSVPLPEANVDSGGDYHELRQDWLAIERAAQPPSPVSSPPPSIQPAPHKPSLVHPAPAPDALPAIGIIIDDVGHSLRQGQRLIALPAPVVLAILPHTQAARQLATEAADAGKTVILHQPMESVSGLSIGPGGLYTGMQREAFRQVLQDNLTSLPALQGLNNHMGSRLTAQRQAMDLTMAVLREHGLFFIDSRTIADTQAAVAAEAAGVPHLSRDVFLDNERTTAAIDAQFERALRLARAQGMALIIGHPYPQTLDYLERRLPGLESQEGVQVLSVTDLLARKYQSH